MIKKVIEISQNGYYLSLKNKQMIMTPKSSDDSESRSFPCEDIGLLVLDNPQITITQSLCSFLLSQGTAIIFCDKTHMPCALSLPFSKNTELALRLEDQLSASVPVQKSLWKQIIQAKISAQANQLKHAPQIQQRLRAIKTQVLSGDKSNAESQAARLYWVNWLGYKFKRDMKSRDEINSMLNYGYAILRSCVARAIVSAGLMPQISLFHCHRSNPYPLADDLMEPFRPMIDNIVSDLCKMGILGISPQTKSYLLKLPQMTVVQKGKIGPFLAVLPRYIQSYIRCLQKRQSKLEIPVAYTSETIKQA